MKNNFPDEILNQVIEKYWQTIPPVWKKTKSQIHQFAISKYGITNGQFQILRGIRNGKDSVSKLAESGYITRPAASRQVDILVNKDLLTRSPNPKDRRYIRLSLTNKGVKMFGELFTISRSFLSEKFSKLAPEQLETLNQALDYLDSIFLSSEEETSKPKGKA